jgi:hypothetical protein
MNILAFNFKETKKSAEIDPCNKRD